MTTSTTWDDRPVPASFLGFFPGKEGQQGGMVEVSDGDSLRLRLELSSIPAFLAVHLALGASCPVFVARDSVTLFAEILLLAEDAGEHLVAKMVWKALQANRVLDLNLAERLLTLADGMSKANNAADAADPTSLTQKGKDVWRLLLEAGKRHEVSNQSMEAFGPLGLGLQLGSAVALKTTALRGLRFRKGAIPHLLKKAISLRDAVFEKVRTAPAFQKWLRRELKNGYPDFQDQALETWRDSCKEELRDARDIRLHPLLYGCNKLHDHVERWPFWALSSSGAYEWSRLMSLCRLAKLLRRHDGSDILKPSFSVLPDLRWDDFNFTCIDVAEAFKALEPSGTGKVVRISFSGLRLAALAAHLVRAHKRTPEQVQSLRTLAQPTGAGVRGEGYTGEQVFVLLTAAGMEHSAITRLASTMFNCEETVNFFECSRPDWLDLLRDHLADDSLALVEDKLGCRAWQLRAAVPDATALDVARAVMHHSGQLMTPDATALDVARAVMHRTDLLMTPDTAARLRAAIVNFLQDQDKQGISAPRYRTANWREHGGGVPFYRKATDENVVMPSGFVRAGLVWIAARFAETFGLAEEAMKSVIYHLAMEGYQVLGFEDEAVWVEQPEGADVSHQQILERALDHFVDASWLETTVYSASED